MLGGELAVLQAPMFDGLSLDPFALFYDGLGPAKVSVSGRHVVQALVIPLVIVVLDERFDLAFEVTGQEVVLALKDLGLIFVPSSLRRDPNPP